MKSKVFTQVNISKELHLEVHSKHRLLGFKSMKAFLEQAVKEALQKYSTPAKNGLLHKSLENIDESED
jgi:hypothetical protein